MITVWETVFPVRLTGRGLSGKDFYQKMIENHCTVVKHQCKTMHARKIEKERKIIMYQNNLPPDVPDIMTLSPYLPDVMTLSQ